MKLRQLSGFIRVCETGSITRAASELNIAQPALGLQIRNLEADIGAELLVRGPRGVYPTPAGEVFLAWAHDVLTSRESVRKRVRELATSPPAHLRLGLPPSVASLISEHLAEWAGREARTVNLAIIKAFSKNISQLVEMEQLDLGLTCAARDRPALQNTPILAERLYYLSAAEDSVGTGDGPISLEEVLSHRIALPVGRDSVRLAVEDGVTRLGRTLENTMEINSLETAKDLAAAGIAGSILPLGGVPEAVGLGLRIRPIESPSLTRTLFLVGRRGHAASQAEQRLVQIMTRTLLHLGEDSANRPYLLPEPRSAALPADNRAVVPQSSRAACCDLASTVQETPAPAPSTARGD